MFFQPVVLLCLFVSLKISGMEVESPVHFKSLPVELLNYIAQFLPWETEEEFIERTQQEKIGLSFPPDYYKYLLGDGGTKEPIVGVFSPDKGKIALFKIYCGGCYRLCNICRAPELVIVDLDQKKDDEKVLFAGTLAKNHYRTIALSASGNMYAGIKKQKRNEVKEQEVMISSHRDVCYDLLVVRDIKKKKERTFEIPEHVTISHLMFNKQCTQVIAHARDYRYVPMQRNYTIFNLQDNVDQKVVEQVNKSNRLLNYFNHYGVCKKYSES